MVWGVLLLLDIPLQISDLLFGDQSELMLFSQCMVIALQVVLIAFFKPFEPVGVTYFALIAGFLEFNLAAIGGFMALFSKFCDTEMGKSYAHYIPMLEALANAFTIGVMLWTLGLILGKLITVLLPSAAASKDDVEEAVEEVEDALHHDHHHHERAAKAKEAVAGILDDDSDEEERQRDRAAQDAAMA
jgi:hypothetical protein